MPKKNFIPLLTDKYSDHHVVRCIETGMKANNHILITGEPGTGKSFFMIRTASYLAAMEQKIIILDSNGSEALDELLDILPEDIVNDSIDIENDKFPIDPFCIKNIKRKDSKANFISDILLSAAYDATDAQADKLKSLILENIDKLIVEDVISPNEIRTFPHRDSCTSFRQILPVTALKILEGRQHVGGFLPCHRQNYA